MFFTSSFPLIFALAQALHISMFLSVSSQPYFFAVSFVDWSSTCDNISWHFFIDIFDVDFPIHALSLFVIISIPISFPVGHLKILSNVNLVFPLVSSIYTLVFPIFHPFSSVCTILKRLYANPGTWLTFVSTICFTSPFFCLIIHFFFPLLMTGSFSPFPTLTYCIGVSSQSNISASSLHICVLAPVSPIHVFLFMSSYFFIFFGAMYSLSSIIIRHASSVRVPLLR